MVTTQDTSVGYFTESTFNTPVTVSRFVEFTSETLDWNKKVKQGQGLRVGRRVIRGARRTVPTADGGGDITLEAASKGLGLFLKAMFGANTSTLVSGSTYQQNITFADTLPSLTIQKGIPDSSGATQAMTFGGCTCDSFEFDFTNADILTIKSTWDAASINTGTAYAAPSYPAEPVNLFHFANAAIYSGTVTQPTTTAIATAITPLAYVRGGSIAVKNNVQNDRFNIGGAGRKAQQLVGIRDISVKLDVELTGNTMLNNIVNDTPLTMVLNYTAGALSVGAETLQIVVTQMFAESELPKSNGANLVIPGMAFTVTEDGTNPGVTCVMRTSDAAA